MLYVLFTVGIVYFSKPRGCACMLFLSLYFSKLRGWYMYVYLLSIFTKLWAVYVRMLGIQCPAPVYACCVLYVLYVVIAWFVEVRVLGFLLIPLG